MSRVTLDQEGRVTLPAELCRRLHLGPGDELLVEGDDTSLSLYPLGPTVRRVYLELTTRCNLACRACVRRVWGEPCADMAADTWDRIIQSLQYLPQLGQVALGGYGEPLLSPLLLDGVEALKRLGTRVVLSTNGTLLNREVAQSLVQLRLDTLVISLDGADPGVFADARQGADLAAVQENVARLNEIKAKQGSLLPRLDIEFVATRSNVGELPALVALAQRLRANRILVTHLLPHTPEMAAQILYQRGEGAPFTAPMGWAVPTGDWLLWGALELPRMHWGAWRQCRFVGNEALVVGWDGGVSPCYALSHSYPYYILGRRKQVRRYTVGNVNQNTLAEIWGCDEYTRFRANVRRFDFPSCVDCDLRDTCDLAETNQGCWGGNPSCADCLWAQDIIRCP